MPTYEEAVAAVAAVRSATQAELDEEEAKTREEFFKKLRDHILAMVDETSEARVALEYVCDQFQIALPVSYWPRVVLPQAAHDVLVAVNMTVTGCTREGGGLSSYSNRKGLATLVVDRVVGDGPGPMSISFDNFCQPVKNKHGTAYRKAAEYRKMVFPESIVLPDKARSGPPVRELDIETRKRRRKEDDQI